MFILKLVRALGFEAFNALRLLYVSKIFHPLMSEELRWTIAVHEAGHTLLAHLHGYTPNGVVAYPHDNFAGTHGITYVRLPFYDTRKSSEMVGVFAAGWIAAEIAGCKEPNYGDDDDLLQIAEVVLRAKMSNDDVVAAYVEARTILKAHVPALMALASELRATSFLDAADIRRVLRLHGV